MRIITCPSCRSELTVDLTKGDHFLCNCGKVLSVREAPSLTEAIPLPPPLPSSDEMFNCPHCGKESLANPSLAGEEVICPLCNNKSKQEGGPSWIRLGTGSVAVIIVLTIFNVVKNELTHQSRSSPPNITALPSIQSGQSNGPTTTRTTKDSWPKSFTDLPVQAVQANAPVPPLDAQEIANLAKARSFCAGRAFVADTVSRQDPAAARRVAFDELAFREKFEKAEINADKILTEHFSDWPETLKASIATIADKIGDTPVDTKVFEAEMKKYGSGQIPSPYLESLLVCHPDYIKLPAKEFNDGFRKEFQSDGGGKSHGVRWRMEYPSSWTSKPGIRPHIVQKFSSRGGRALAGSAIQIVALPAEVEVDKLTTDDLFELMDFGAFGSDYSPIDTGIATLASKRTVWREFEWRAERVGIQIETHAVVFCLIYDRNLVSIWFDASWTPSYGPGQVAQKFAEQSPLFRQMLLSFDIMNRYEP